MLLYRASREISGREEENMENISKEGGRLEEGRGGKQEAESL